MRSSTAPADISATALVAWAAFTSPGEDRAVSRRPEHPVAWRPDAPGTSATARPWWPPARSWSPTGQHSSLPADEPQTGDIDGGRTGISTRRSRASPGSRSPPTPCPPTRRWTLPACSATSRPIWKPSNHRRKPQSDPAELGCCAAVSDSDHRPPDGSETAMTKTACTFASHPGIAEPEWLRAGQDLRDVALQLRIMLSSGTSFAIATVVSAYGIVLRQPGTVVVISESGETIGLNPAGPLDGAIRDLAAQALAMGRTSSNGWKSITRLPATSACPAEPAWKSTRCGCGQVIRCSATCCATSTVAPRPSWSSAPVAYPAMQ